MPPSKGSFPEPAPDISLLCAAEHFCCPSHLELLRISKGSSSLSTKSISTKSQCSEYYKTYLISQKLRLYL